MKLVLKRILENSPASPYCLQTEDGEVLPCQVRVMVEQEVEKLTTVTVVFRVDDNCLRIVGSPRE